MIQEKLKLRDELYQEIKDAGFEYLTIQGSHFCYDNLSGIAEKEGQEITAHNMLLYAPALDSDLMSMFS